jgi:hypothetical protein
LTAEWHIKRVNRVPITLLLIAPWFTSPSEAACDHIRVLDKEEAKLLVAEEFRDTTMTAGPSQQWVVEKAGTLMTPLLCQAVQRVAFVDQGLESNAGLAGRTDRRAPDLLQISAAEGPGLASEPELRLPDELPAGQTHAPQDERNYRLSKERADLARVTSVQAVLHEGAHAADYLLQMHDADDAGTWSTTARNLAREVIDKNRLQIGFRTEWARLHNSFVAVGMAIPWHGKKLQSGLSPQELVRGGFMSEYGGDKVSDDIAETTAWALSSSTYRAAAGSGIAGEKALACAAMRKLPGPDIPREYAAAFAKLGFLQSTGFISEEAYRDCVGKLAIRGDGPGFHSFRGGKLFRNYAGDVQISIGQIDGQGPYIFEMSATGMVSTSAGDVPGVVFLQLNVLPAKALAGPVDIEDVSYPRGIYLAGYRHSRDNKFYITRADTGAKLMELAQGVVLVARANRDLIEGSIFIQRFLNLSTSLSGVAGDEPPKEAFNITFRYER